MADVQTSEVDAKHESVNAKPWNLYRDIQRTNNF